MDYRHRDRHRDYRDPAPYRPRERERPREHERPREDRSKRRRDTGEFHHHRSRSPHHDPRRDRPPRHLPPPEPVRHRSERSRPSTPPPQPKEPPREEQEDEDDQVDYPSAIHTNQAYRARVMAQLEDIEDKDEATKAAERKQRRQEILRRYAQPQPDQPLADPVMDVQPINEDQIEPAAKTMRKAPEPKAEAPDIFSASPTADEALMTRTHGAVMTQRREHNASLSENWDDADGYYLLRVNDLLAGRYKVLRTKGKGVFSTVCLCEDVMGNDVDLPRQVAIKIIRNNDLMHKAGLKELGLLTNITKTDPHQRSHCVRLLNSFEHRGHLCMVFECLEMDLRKVLEAYGKDIGLSIQAVKVYTYQLLIGLKHMERLGILHGDIKPDNMLVNKNKNVLKICDFGSAATVDECEITPYLVSRFYRAPEIILGLPYSTPADMWSVGCTIFELYTGRYCFNGGSNNQMLRLHMELKGKVPHKMLRKAMFTGNHFDDAFTFLSREQDAISSKPIVRPMPMLQPTRDLLADLVGPERLSDDEMKDVVLLKDFLDRVFVLDPQKRITVAQALAHPFVRRD